MRSATRSASPSLSGRTAERCSSGRGMPHIMISVRLCGCWVGCRALSLLGAATLGVHQLRYALAYGAEADDAAAAQGHGYLEAGGAIVGTLLVAAFAQSLSRLAHRRGPFGSHWPVAAPVADRELGTDRGVRCAGTDQGMLSAGHPAGLAGVCRNGGWLAVLLALALAALVAAILRGAEAILTRFAATRTTPRARARDALALAACRSGAPGHRACCSATSSAPSIRGEPSLARSRR